MPAMVYVSLTRLRLRSIRFLPALVVDVIRTRAQVSKAEGYLVGNLLTDRKLAFWTMTAWESEASMRRYMTSGAHKTAMPKLMHWCDEASIAHWTQETAVLPPWNEADRRMRETGRPSKVRYPSAEHAGLTYREPHMVAADSVAKRATKGNNRP